MTDKMLSSQQLSVSESTVSVVNPATGTPFAQVPRMSIDSINSVIESAVAAYSQLLKMPLAKRATILKKTADLMLQNQEDLAQTLAMETGKPIRDSRVEVLRGIHVIIFCAEEAKIVLEGRVHRVDAYEYPVGNENRLVMTTREPMGIILAITPFNFPSNSFCHKVGPSFIAGNATIVKPSQVAPLSAMKLAEIMKRAGAPEGSVSVVTGYSREIGDYLVDHPEARFITFTGSTEVGLRIASRAAAKGKRAIMELGGSDAAIVMKDSDLSKVMKTLVRGRFDYAGQNCNSTKRLVVHSSISSKFSENFVELTKELKLGNPLEETTDVGPVINEESVRFAENVTRDAIQKGAKLLYGGKRAFDKGFFYTPTVLADVPKDALALAEEVFGPVAPITTFETIDEAIEIANSTPYGLQSAIFTSDTKKAIRMSREIKAGAVIINDSTRLRWDALPFGGVKNTGFGREGVRDSILEMTESKVTSINLGD
jgi:succinyl-CoA reductase